MKEKQVLAADFGASSGRVMLGGFDGKRFSVKEIHRFSNDPVFLGDTMYWDVLRLFHELKQGMAGAKQYGQAVSVGIDTWGVDFGLLNEQGTLLGNPVHYRDRRTEGMLKEGLKRAGRERLYQITGNQFMEINTAFQLMAMKRDEEALLSQARTLLLMPDLFQYFLSGNKSSEYSIASTTQLFDARRRCWSDELMESLGIPAGIFLPAVPGAVKTGVLRRQIKEELGLADMAVTAVAGHDTQSAMAAVPAEEKDFLFISCGTWSLFGTETEEPVISDVSLKHNLTNEIGIGGACSFLKNIIGLWLVQESRRQWRREGREYSFGQLEAMAAGAKAIPSVIDPDAPEFVPAGDVPCRIREFCRRTGQMVPETEGELVRCINQSLALTYRKAMEEIYACTGKTYKTIYVIGGGAQSAMLCQMTADACRVPVAAGPVEATVYGNLMAQYMALGEIRDLAEGRQILRASITPKIYLPEDNEFWDEAYERYLRISGA